MGPGQPPMKLGAEPGTGRMLGGARHRECAGSPDYGPATNHPLGFK
ncbi:hypothetical protein [Actinopolymorpha pittospori]|uniref:Uncharacterized protein n=1 Tax=Actinopolymorpha pittospori TaxID=648752 RepID=A0A927MUH6_9ACTN|nr:hypothetical protein [Actinopolymorpha pittospori]MBE1603537.1 hypothetical protein [Actinopolymorpha pittospori]